MTGRGGSFDVDMVLLNVTPTIAMAGIEVRDL
jgi:hypothetical protein